GAPVDGDQAAEGVVPFPGMPLVEPVVERASEDRVDGLFGLAELPRAGPVGAGEGGDLSGLPGDPGRVVEGGDDRDDVDAHGVLLSVVVVLVRGRDITPAPRPAAPRGAN